MLQKVHLKSEEPQFPHWTWLKLESELVQSEQAFSDGGLVNDALVPSLFVYVKTLCVPQSPGASEEGPAAPVSVLSMACLRLPSTRSDQLSATTVVRSLRT